uniref:Uncharacterized protein n=1 Tax=Acrobeloides nanus TaxID=290746 RepID=A0A914DWP2_9BILA
MDIAVFGMEWISNVNAMNTRNHWMDLYAWIPKVIVWKSAKKRRTVDIVIRKQVQQTLKEYLNANVLKGFLTLDLVLCKINSNMTVYNIFA